MALSGQAFPVEKRTASYACVGHLSSICRMHPQGMVLRLYGTVGRCRVDWYCLLFAWAMCPLLVRAQGGQEEMRERAESAYVAGNFSDALADFERLVSLYPEEACLHGRLAGCALREPGRLALVRRHLRIALRMGCDDIDLGFHQARLAQLEYDFDRAKDLYANYLIESGKKGRFRVEAELALASCRQVGWNPSEAVALDVFERIPAEPDKAFRYYQPEVEGLRLVATPGVLRSKADLKVEPGRMALHDGDTVLVYASLGRKGEAGWDLFKVAIRGGAYTEPINLGEGVNSAFDEQDAYLSRDGVLYFSSNRPGGLGGFDIYAAPCGQDGMPTEAPYRLPYPINSVNDDFFFIPETGGGAWLASDRAASEGRIHAYHVAIGQGVLATGSVAWSPDEVEREGLTLRVFSNGDEVASGGLDGEGARHLAFEGDASVRLVLEDRQGNIVAEEFGAGSGAWELRRTSTGWALDEQTDVLADWAVLSDLQVGNSVAADGASASAADAGTETVRDAEPSAGWSTWLTDRMADDAVAENTENEEVVATADAVLEDIAGTENVALDATSPGTIAPVGFAGDEASEPDGAVDPSEPTGDVTDALPGSWAERDVESLQDWKPEDPEQVQEMLDEDVDVVVAVWEGKAERILSLEAEFLDDPDFTKAGELFDLLDGLEAWNPDAGKLRPLLRDGVAIDDIRHMLDVWTEAVQSATKASLARVAGEAALAYRRDRLAARELNLGSGTDVNDVKSRWSRWQDARRGLPGTDPEDAEMTNEEGTELLGLWSHVLREGSTVWSRKALSGWRGEWLERELDLLQRSEMKWSEVQSDALAEAPSSPDTTADPVNVATSGSEGPEEDRDRAANEVGKEVQLPAGEGDLELTSFLWSEAKGVEPGDDPTPSESGVWKQQWDEAVAASKPVGRALDKLEKALDGDGFAAVSDEDGWDGLNPDVAAALLSLSEVVIEELESVMDQRGQHRESLIEAWNEAMVDGGDMMEPSGRQALQDGLDSLDAWSAEIAVRKEEAGRTVGFARWTALEEAQLLMRKVESGWAEWEKGWAMQSEVLTAARRSAEASEQAARSEPAGDGDVVDMGGGVEAAAEEVRGDDVAEAFEEPVVIVSEEADGPEARMDNMDGAADGEIAPDLTVDTNEEGREFEAMRAMDRLWESGQRDGWSPAEREAREAWLERLEIMAEQPSASAGRPARMAWDKRKFFNDRRWRLALKALDLESLERRLAAPVDVAENEPALEGAPGLEVPSEVASEPTVFISGVADGERGAAPVRDAQEEDAAPFGLVLPAAEVIVDGQGNGGGGLRLRALDRETVERSILEGDWSAAGAAMAEARFAGERGAPKSEGVEYKVQIGAFRNALPAALFAAFDPMWAQRLANGVTRYMAGSFDAYDPAVIARDAIRALGYTDAFVVRFVDGERLSGRPEPEALAEERERQRPVVGGETGSAAVGSPAATDAGGAGGAGNALPVRREDIPTWDGVRGRVYSVQVGAFRGVPDAAALAELGTLTREDAGADGWLRLFSGRFETQAEAEEHRDALKQGGRTDAFIVVYINGRRIPLTEASTTSVAPLPGAPQNEPASPSPSDNGNQDDGEREPTVGDADGMDVVWRVELGVFASTIPVRLANAILDAPLDWEIRSSRTAGRTAYRTKGMSESAAREVMADAREMGFTNARILQE